MRALIARLRAPLVFVLFAGLYVVFARVHSVRVNTDAGRHDQSTYLWGARMLHDTHFAAFTNRSQMPAYLYVQALFFPDRATDAEIFARAKAVSIGLSVLLVIALCIFFARALPKVEARVAMLVTAFTLFVFRAAYVQAELLFYTAAFFGFVALCRLWERPSFGMAALAGLLEALAFLCKGSVQPGLAVFVVLYLARSARRAWRAPPHGSGDLVRRAAEVALLLASFVAPLTPYLVKSKELYGSYFFNVNTRYVIWCDTWDDFLAREASLGKWWTWGALPPDQLPSMGRYFREHSAFAVAWREVRGIVEVLGNLVLGTGYLEFLLVYLAFLAVSLGFTRAPLRTLVSIDPGSRVAFVIPYALVYLGAFGFYGPIAAGARFSLMLLLPLLYTALRAGAALQPKAKLGARTVTWSDLNAVVYALAVVDALVVVPLTIGWLYAGG